MILAIDQGSRKCGWALLATNGSVAKSGQIKLKGKDRRQRYANLIDQLFDIFEDNTIDLVAVEDVFLKRSSYQNPKVLAIMGETRGIIIGLALRYTHNIVDINPSEVTKFLGINPRKEDKKQLTQLYVKDLIGEVPEEDQADAVIIGLIAYNKERG